MAKNRLVIVTNAPREHIWEDSYHYDMSGETDMTEKIADDPQYRKGELCLAHPAIIAFYGKHKKSFVDELKKGVTTTFPYVIDRTRERGGFGLQISIPKGEIPALACDVEVNRGLLGEEVRNTMNARYLIIPLRTGEFAEVPEDDLESVLKAYEKANLNISQQQKSEIRKKLAVLKSFDVYLREKAIIIRDIPIEVTRRKGEIDRKSLRKYTL